MITQDRIAARSTDDRASRRSHRPGRVGPDHVAASVGVAALTVITAFGMSRVFAGWEYLRPLVVMALVVHAVALGLRVARVPVLIALPVGALAIYETTALLFYRSSMRFGLPSGATADLAHIDLRLVWTQFPTAVAPVPGVGAYVVVAALAIGVVALLADAFAFRAFGRAEAAVPSGVLFVFTAALGTERHRILATAGWLAAALVVVGLLRALHGGADESWLGRRGRAMRAAAPAALSVAIVAALVAALAGPELPGAGSDPLLDTRKGDGDVTQVLNPFVDIRSQLVNRSNTEMFTVESPRGSYWRVSGSSVFDGDTFSPYEGPLDSVDGDINPSPAGATLLQQRFTIARWRGKQVPAAFAPVLVSQDDVYWEPVDGTLIVDQDVDTGQVFNVTSYDPNPGPDALRSTSASSPPDSHFLDLPDDFPVEAIEAARAATAAATTPYDQALALQNWFRTEFTYDLNVQQGHNDDAILNFLEIKRGYCEQFAASFAAMGRALGLPTRVAVGYTQGEQQPDGSFKVYGKHAHAWPEVWFDGYGWVLFEPTPGRGAPGHEATTGVDAAQDTTALPTGGDPVAATAGPPTSRQLPTVSTEPGLVTGTPTTAPITVPAPRSGGGGVGTGVWIFLALVALAIWVIAMPTMVTRFTRRGSTPSEQVISAWHGTVGALTYAGAAAPLGLTPIEWATVVDDQYVVDRRAIVELARFVTRAIYAPDGVGDPVALRAAVLHTQLERGARDVTPWYLRAMLRIDPRLVRQRLVGDAPLLDRIDEHPVGVAQRETVVGDADEVRVWGPSEGQSR